MVRDVPGDDVSQRPHGHGIVARDTRPVPRLLGHALEKGDRPEAHDFKLLDEVSP